MMKRFLAFIFFVIGFGPLLAQDMPPLPPLPDQNQAAASSATSSVPVVAPPPNPGAATAATPDLPPLPAQTSAASAPAAPSTPAMPSASPSPAAEPAAPAPPPAPAAPDNSAAAPSTEAAAPETAPAPKKKHALKPWQVSNARPNVIFGGWVVAKGGNESSRIAWTSQEILNALLFKKYKLLNPMEGKAEEGTYDGQKGFQWRQFSFKAPKTKQIVQVYIRQSGKKVWMRVGPGEAVHPAEYSLDQAKKMRESDMAALHILQKKFGKHLSPHRVTAHWEAPYRYDLATADE